MKHLESLQLAAIADDESQLRDAGDAAHLAACSDCQLELDELRAVVNEFRNPAFWRKIDASSELDVVPGLAALQAFRRKFQQEVTAADEMLRRGSLEDLQALLLTGRVSGTLGLVEALIERSEQERVSNPTAALHAAKLAVDVSGDIPNDESYRNSALHFRGLAEKELANVLRVLGRFEEALASLDRATAHFEMTPASHFDQIGVDFVRATIWAATERYAEALRLAKSCAVEFREYGDVSREAHARILEAYVYALQGQPAQASALLDPLVAPLEDVGDHETLATVWSNLGACAIELRDWPAAIGFLEQARGVFQKLGHWLGEARSRWQLGNVHIGQGNYAIGIDLLSDVRVEFLGRHLPIEVVFVSLELVDALLATARLDDARAVCRTLPDECVRLGMPSNALAAVAYLRETSRALTPDRVRQVRSYFERFQKDAAVVFASLP